MNFLWALSSSMTFSGLSFESSRLPNLYDVTILRLSSPRSEHILLTSLSSAFLFSTP